MRKIVINTCCGGFGVSPEASHFIAERKNVRLVVEENVNGDRYYPYYYLTDQPYGEPVNMDADLWERGTLQNFRDLDRTDDDLIAAVESLGDLACMPYSRLKVVEIPDNVEWEIMEYDGTEWVAEKHRTWS